MEADRRGVPWMFLLGVLLIGLAEWMDFVVHRLEYGESYDVAVHRIVAVALVAFFALWFRSSRARWVIAVIAAVWGAGFSYQAARYRSLDAAIIAALDLGALFVLCTGPVSAWFKRRPGA